MKQESKEKKHQIYHPPELSQFSLVEVAFHPLVTSVDGGGALTCTGASPHPAVTGAVATGAAGAWETGPEPQPTAVGVASGAACAPQPSPAATASSPPSSTSSRYVSIN